MSYPPRMILREVVDSDLPIFFEHQRDSEAVRMAAFPSRDQDAFMTHWAKLRPNPSNIIRTIVCDGQVAGNIGSWIAEDQRLIGYWIGREFWGRGVATAALAAFVAEVKERPHLLDALSRMNSASVPACASAASIQGLTSVRFVIRARSFSFEVPSTFC